MGVPKFYRWLSERYPLVNQAIDASTLLPAVDCLYLDMNGIIHNATHGNEGITKLPTEKDMMLSILAYVDSMVKLVKPQQLLYMAVDGVAPRAKMNQQRSRRFRAARDLAEARKEAALKGEEIEDEAVFDSNCITPGTEFMDKVSRHMKYFIRRKLKEDPVWQAMRVIFSGHEVPGEGEHKIMEYIRTTRMQPGYNANMRHCVAGLDADLIMLGLATHEPHFTLLREQVDFQAFKANKYGTKTAQRETKEKKWQLLHVGVLREYLEIDLRPELADTLSFPYDGERVIDDFVLMCALCGNDFLPHLPSLDIGEGAVDTLIRLYKQMLPSWGGYLTEEGLIHLDRLEALLAHMGTMEEEIFAMRAKEAARFARKQRRANRRVGDAVIGLESGALSDMDSDIETPAADVADSDITPAARAAAEEAILASTAARLALETNQVTGGVNDDVVVDDTGREIRRPPSPYIVGALLHGGTITSPPNGGTPAVQAPPVATFKERYYLDKFGITYKKGSSRDDDILNQLAQSYVEALQWVMLYYYRGCPSWGWFFPFHYAPMTSDIVNLAAHPVSFRLGRPFRPFQQLLGCLPAASGKFLPAPYRALMTEEWSPLLEFYPPVADIKVDMNGKRNPWEGITLIPFIQEAAMLDALRKYCPDDVLSDDERRRNSFGVTYVFWYDESCADTVPSSLPGAFPDVPGCQSRVSVMQEVRTPVLTNASAAAVAASPEASVDEDSTIAVNAGLATSAALYSARPRPGCVVPAAGYPTLHTLHFTPVLQAVSLNVFGFASKKDTLVLAIGSGRRIIDRGVESDDEDGAMLAAAAAFHEPASDPGPRHGEKRSPALSPLNPAYRRPDGNASSPVSRPPLHPPHHDHVSPAHSGLDMGAHAAPLPLQAHTPSFSTTYAEGTTVVPTSVPLDVATIVRGPGAAGHHAREPLRAREVARAVLGKIVYVDWPHVREGVVVSVSDALEEVMAPPDFAGPGAEPVVASHTADASVTWVRAAHSIQSELLTGRRALGICGIQIGSVQVIIKVRKLIGMRRDPETGALSRVFAPHGSSGEVATVPELVLMANPAPDQRFVEQGPQTLQVRFPLGASVVVLRGEARGTLAKVAGYTPGPEPATPSVALELDARTTPTEPAFGHSIASTIKDKYIDARRAADALGITTQVLGRVTASVYVNPGGFDVGLNLKVNRGVYLPGYVRSTSSEAVAPAWCSGAATSTSIVSAPAMSAAISGAWEYTERAIHLVAAYQRAWPQVFAILETESGGTGSIDVRAFPGGAETLVRICTWLQQLETYSRPLVPISTQVMCPDAIRAVQKAADTVNAAAARGIKTLHVSNVRARDVYARESQSYAVGGIGEGQGVTLSTENVDGASCIPILGDRVVNLSFKKAPLGLRGTVVAIHPASGFVEVVFDEEFVGGTSLGGLCTNGRGGLVPWSALLCASRVPTAEPEVPAMAAAEAARATAGGIAPEGLPRGKRGVVRQTAGASEAPAAATDGAARSTVGVQRGGGARVAAGPPADTASGSPGFKQRGGRVAGGSPPASGALNLPAIAEQVEFYFSDSNLASDEFMRKLIAADASREGWCDIAAIARFKRMQKLAGGDVGVIAAAVAAHSKVLRVSPDRLRVARVHPYPLAAPAVAPASTVPVPSSVASAAPGAVAPAPAYPAVASTFAAPSTAAPTAGGAAMADLARYWQQAMAGGVAAPVAGAAPTPAVAATEGAPVASPQPAAGGRAHFDALMQSLQRSSAPPTAAPAAAPATGVAGSIPIGVPISPSVLFAAAAASAPMGLSTPPVPAPLGVARAPAAAAASVATPSPTPGGNDAAKKPARGGGLMPAAVRARAGATPKPAADGSAK